MSGRRLLITDLLSRVNLPQGLEKTCALITEEYQLGQLLKVDPLFVGHEELNTRIETTKGNYVIKFLNKRKTELIAESVIHVMKSLLAGGIPVSHILSKPDGKDLYKLSKEYGSGYLIVMNYFSGVTFNESKPNEEDIINMTGIVARMHQLDFDTEPEYDPWLPQYLSEEFKSKSRMLSQVDIAQVTEVIQIFHSIDWSQCRKAIGHFDLHRDNAKKDIHGNYCLFDMATVGKDYVLFDLGTFIGLFCFEPTNTVNQNFDVFHLVVQEYLTRSTLNSYEQDHLFDFVKIIFASNVLAANALIKDGDDTQETLKWYQLGKWGLNTFLHSTA